VTYDARETSVQGGQPVEIFDIVLPEETYRFTSYGEDVEFGGETYTAVAIGCGPRELVQLGKVREVTITLAIDNALAASLRANGIPPIDALVTIRCFHVGDLESRQLWKGYIGGTSTDEKHALLRVPNLSDEVFNRGLPVLVAQRTCPHMLYDTGCGVDEDSFKITPTVSSVSSDGTEIVVSSISGNPDAWAQDGKVVRATTGEARSVLEQTGTTITIDVPFRALQVGDTLNLFAGCDHTIAGPRGCLELFNNVLNFGGDPEMPADNPSAPTGLGVSVQV
jgi:uncharacterized phage protein (TIGR02218 family)